MEIDISLFDIESAISSLEWNSGAGPDELSPYVIKKCETAIVWPIWLLYQKSVDEERIPDAMKVSQTVPVYKRKGVKSDVKNYRVVEIAPIVMKIHEIAVKRKISGIIEPSLSNTQHGFRPGRSVTTNLLNLSMLAHKAFEHANQLDIFYGDFRTAFDTVWIKLLIMKLARFDIGRRTAKWICQYLRGRRNIVQIGTVKSSEYSSPSGTTWEFARPNDVCGIHR